MTPARITPLMISPRTLLGLLMCLPLPALAQDDSVFLACERFSDRDQRLACLEEALEAATDNDPQEQAPATAPVPPRETVDNAPTQPPADSAPPTAAGDQPDSSPATASTERVETFGISRPRVAENEEGDEELHDTVTELDEIRPNQWRIALASGQVWFQVHPKRFNLREGFPVRIYPSDWGDNFRLDTEELSGFIQVRRLE